MLIEEFRRELSAHRGYIRRNSLFLVLGLLSLRLGGWLGEKLGLTLLLWHGAIALTQPIFTLLARERSDARVLPVSGQPTQSVDGAAAATEVVTSSDRAVRAFARLMVLLAMTMPSAVLLAFVFLSRVGRDAFVTPLAASVCLIVGGVLLLVMTLGAVAIVARSTGILVLAYAAAASLVAFGMTAAGSAVLPGIPLWLALATGNRWALTVTLLWQLSCAALLLAIVVETRLARR